MPTKRLSFNTQQLTWMHLFLSNFISSWEESPAAKHNPLQRIKTNDYHCASLAGISLYCALTLVEMREEQRASKTETERDRTSPNFERKVSFR